MRRTRRRAGFLLMDMSLGLALVLGMSVAMAVAIGHQRRQLRILKQQRTAAVRTERAMDALRRNMPLPGDVDLSVEPLTQNAPPDWQWVRITGRVDDQTARLIGLIPRSGAP